MLHTGVRFAWLTPRLHQTSNATQAGSRTVRFEFRLRGQLSARGGASVMLGFLARRWPWRACVLLAAVMAAASGAPALPGGLLCHRSRWGRRGGGATGGVRRTARPPPVVRDGPNAWDIWLRGVALAWGIETRGRPPFQRGLRMTLLDELPRELCPARVGNRPRRSATRRLRGHAPMRWPCWPPCSRRRRSWVWLSA